MIVKLAYKGKEREREREREREKTAMSVDKVSFEELYSLVMQMFPLDSPNQHGH